MGRTFVHLSLLAVACVAAAPIARAETVILKSELKAANEVPPNASTASGAAEASFDTATRTLSWKVTYSGLTGPAMGAHFHGPSEAGKNAGIVLPFKSPETPITGSAVITDAQAADLLAGKWYANVHTQANPGGEIRGQMTRQ
ncbi:CHRD domain-containing protein [Bradyrhizobium sp. SZCCHNR1015]|uniref:CHRD domain-containing protein n=1 Tax=Bradyrhizobium sp. SZCCHNR1015 TaxID=3057338 RepID=UPI002916C403|nr:CHRD domain-containing protein [Bradyrhizobium sp. SZCCHNR1015]